MDTIYVYIHVFTSAFCLIEMPGTCFLSIFPSGKKSHANPGARRVLETKKVGVAFASCFAVVPWSRTP